MNSEKVMRIADSFKTAGNNRAMNKVKYGVLKVKSLKNLTSNIYIFSSCQFTYLDKSTFAGRLINIYIYIYIYIYMCVCVCVCVCVFFPRVSSHT